MRRTTKIVAIISLLSAGLIIFNLLITYLSIEFITKIGILIFGNILLILFFIAQLVIALRTTCDVCGQNPKLFLTNYPWSMRQSRELYERKYCLLHLESFLEVYKQKLNQSAGKFIFLKEEKYFFVYRYLSLEDLRSLRPGYYSEEDIQFLAHMLNSMEAVCQICQRPSRVLLMHAGTINYSVAPPLIKNKSFLEFTEVLCVECFLQFISQEIHRRAKKFLELRIDLPRNQMGIYLFEE